LIPAVFTFLSVKVLYRFSASINILKNIRPVHFRKINLKAYLHAECFYNLSSGESAVWLQQYIFLNKHFKTPVENSGAISAFGSTCWFSGDWLLLFGLFF